MNWDAIGAIGEVIGGAAVIASLLYLAIQIRNSSAIARAESQRDLLSITPIMSLTTSNRQLIEVIQAALDDFDRLPNVDQAQFHSWAHLISAITESAFRMHRSGMIDDAMYTGYRGAFLGLITTTGGAQWWKITQPLWPSDFAAEINSSLESERDRIVSWSVSMPFFVSRDSRGATASR